MPKATTPTPVRQGRRHNPLEDDLLATGLLRQKAPKRKAKDAEQEDDFYVESKASKKILQLGRELVEEDQKASATAGKSHDAFAFGSRLGDEGDDEDDAFFQEEEAWADEDGVVEEIEVDPEDLATFNKFLPNEQDEDPLLKHGWDRVAAAGEEEASERASMNLADIILAKIREREAEGGASKQPHEASGPDELVLPQKAIDVYTQCGLLLSRWKSGKLPKPMKILGTLPVEQFEALLDISRPDLWTPNACFEMTKIMISSKAPVAQRFLELVILDRVRDAIRETKSLSGNNVHLFNALKKSLFKPTAFFKGFLFPLVLSGSLSLREARIVSAVLTRTSIPVLHSSAALKALVDISTEVSVSADDASAINILIKALLDKRYALPYQVIDAMVMHFLRAKATQPDGVMPVIWHQCFLVFAQRYHGDISEDQREALLDLLLTHSHTAIGPEIRKELLAGRGRGVPIEPQTAVFDGDDTMLVDS